MYLCCVCYIFMLHVCIKCMCVVQAQHLNDFLHVFLLINMYKVTCIKEYHDAPLICINFWHFM